MFRIKDGNWGPACGVPAYSADKTLRKEKCISYAAVIPPWRYRHRMKRNADIGLFRNLSYLTASHFPDDL